MATHNPNPQTTVLRRPHALPRTLRRLKLTNSPLIASAAASMAKRQPQCIGLFGFEVVVAASSAFDAPECCAKTNELIQGTGRGARKGGGSTGKGGGSWPMGGDLQLMTH